MNPIITAAASLTRTQAAQLIARQGYYKHKKTGALVKPSLQPICSSFTEEKPDSWAWMETTGLAVVRRLSDPDAPWVVEWTDLGRAVAEVLCLAEQRQPTIFDVNPS